MTTLLPPTPPGEILAEDFLGPMGISQYKLAHDIGVPRSRVAAIVAGTRAITADTALRLSRYFGLSERYWLEAQLRYDLEVAHDTLAGELQKITPIAS